MLIGTRPQEQELHFSTSAPGREEAVRTAAAPQEALERCELPDMFFAMPHDEHS